jgi:hypothetical protein
MAIGNSLRCVILIFMLMSCVPVPAQAQTEEASVRAAVSQLRVIGCGLQYRKRTLAEQPRFGIAACLPIYVRQPTKHGGSFGTLGAPKRITGWRRKLAAGHRNL